MGDLALSLMVLCAAAMLGGAFFAFRRGDAKRAVLMLVLAIVIAANVAIWTIPGPDGTATLADVPGDDLTAQPEG
ncbi:hypothetical protein [Croceicoccus mobilis]|uniref:Uncharacterized protein n=1 Tax=Croceicoccus mobilis TaxID=1703339 RepID=A0A916Z6I3_9SPHN|nr:hypothetical protein [Croceicoccus mobilis]GGD77694.1 hypothetical protein GCM10010990_29300 [Croceicoccus mobilis]